MRQGALSIVMTAFPVVTSVIWDTASREMAYASHAVRSQIVEIVRVLLAV